MKSLNHTENPDEIATTRKGKREMQWEENHKDITNFITQHLAEFGAMPDKSLIAKATGLSRKTVHKHLRGYAEMMVDENDMSGFEVMTELVSAQILKAALRGDLNAAKLFLETSKSWHNSKVIRRNNLQVHSNLGVR